MLVMEVEQGLISNKYRVLGKKGEGTFSEVLKCQNIDDGSLWACKKLKRHYKSADQVNCLREVQAMRKLAPHPNIIQLHELLFDVMSGTVVLVCELMNMNIYEFIKGRKHYLSDTIIKNYMYQLCKSVDHMHRCGIFHRDIKPENILIKDDHLKLADFGSCRSSSSKQPYTEYISTRWYRSPECLLTDGFYTYKMDVWSTGCVFYEIISLEPLFPGSSEVDQIAKIHSVLGTPGKDVLGKFQRQTRGVNFNFPAKKGSGIEGFIPQARPECVDLIYKMCTYDPDERITARHALKHIYFRELWSRDKRAELLAKRLLSKSQSESTSIRPRSSQLGTSPRNEVTPRLPPVPLTTRPSADPPAPHVSPEQRQINDNAEEKNDVPTESQRSSEQPTISDLVKPKTYRSVKKQHRSKNNTDEEDKLSPRRDVSHHVTTILPFPSVDKSHNRRQHDAMMPHAAGRTYKFRLSNFSRTLPRIDASSPDCNGPSVGKGKQPLYLSSYRLQPQPLINQLNGNRTKDYPRRVFIPSSPEADR